MKKMITGFLLAGIFLTFQNGANAQMKDSLLRHIVIITFKPDASADSIKALDDVYRSLSKSAAVKDFEMGVNISTRDTSLKHVYVTSFASKSDIDIYRKQPVYASLFKLSLPISSDVTVADYWVSK